MTKAEEFRQYADKRNKEMNIPMVLYKDALKEIEDAACRGKYEVDYYIEKSNYVYIKSLKKILKENGFKVSFFTYPECITDYGFISSRYFITIKW